MSDRVKAILVQMSQLNESERRALREHLLAAPPAPAVEKAVGEPSTQPVSWSSLHGIAPGLLGGEDAQAWVTRTRQESDRVREIRRW